MHTTMMRTMQMGALTLALFGMGIGHAQAQFTETFDSGSATYTANDPYWLSQNFANGFIVKDTNSLFGGAFATEITQDVSGTGYFLFTGTASYPGNGGNIPAGQDQFYISPTFTVTPNTLYNVSFYLTDANFVNNPPIQPEIDGTLLGAPVTPVGFFKRDGWQQFTFSWNSGANTSASLILHDLEQTPVGNDFGLDNISVQAAVPEPSSLALLAGLGVAGMRLLARRRRAR